MLSSSSHERLNSIAGELGGIKRYLEIGVAKGTTFFEINAIEKHAVDPRFRFNPRSRNNFPNEFYHKQTSDEFFYANIGRQNPFDLIFLDGLHTYSQTLRDFLTSQALAHSRTIWLIDDTFPTDFISAESDLQRVKAAREAKGCPEDETWMGDVYKVVAFIDSFCPQYTCLTLDGHGQTVILPMPRKQKHVLFTSLEEIDKLSYLDVLLLRNTLLRPVILSQVLKQIANLPTARIQ